MPQLNDKRLIQQAEVARQVKELNLSRSLPYYDEHDDGVEEDHIRIYLSPDAGLWSGNYRQFQALCSMVRQLTESRTPTWQTLGLSYLMWDELQKFVEDVGVPTPLSAIQVLVRNLRGRT